MATIYHGSRKIITSPEYGKGKPYNDYGLGFYCTEHIELAKEWACVENGDGYANEYELNLDGLKVLNLLDCKYTILNWLAILLDNRGVTATTPTARKAIAYIINNYLPDYKDYDVIIGYRADDSYFSFARDFVTNQITIDQLGYAMNLGKLGEQIVIKSKKAFESLTFIKSHTADSKIYYIRKKKRDLEARESYFDMLEKDTFGDVYISSIMKGEKI